MSGAMAVSLFALSIFLLCPTATESNQAENENGGDKAAEYVVSPPSWLEDPSPYLTYASPQVQTDTSRDIESKLLAILLNMKDDDNDDDGTEEDVVTEEEEPIPTIRPQVVVKDEFEDAVREWPFRVQTQREILWDALNPVNIINDLKQAKHATTTSTTTNTATTIPVTTTAVTTTTSTTTTTTAVETTSTSFTKFTKKSKAQKKSDLSNLADAVFQMLLNTGEAKMENPPPPPKFSYLWDALRGSRR